MSVHHTHFLPRPGVSGKKHWCLKRLSIFRTFASAEEQKKAEQASKELIADSVSHPLIYFMKFYDYSLMSELQKVVPCPTFGNDIYRPTVLEGHSQTLGEMQLPPQQEFGDYIQGEAGYLHKHDNPRFRYELL